MLYVFKVELLTILFLLAGLSCIFARKSVFLLAYDNINILKAFRSL